MSLPAEICSLEQLTKLGAGENSLTYLPEKFSNLRSLKWLSLVKNQITVLPHDFYKLEKLTYLDLSYNRLEKIQDSLRRLKCLAYLNLQHNEINVKPGEISKGFTNLHRLDLRHTKVTKLPTSMLHFEVMLIGDENDDVIGQENNMTLQHRTRRKKF
jgi:Leucine-rich repeat (LRR) protein